ncbi:hypothetical protein Agub_g8522 [Astrephomene gubernaculifera]|uniref:Endonuclease/exonuclease/phosphatase domain-containing protein n=1 Tax=Astrephomene gubernaculifera TaxID=47775 RepID=A0AAD3HNB4_9CHLO|nr:hypothetical protein Agub_g8522 [Astrephomene gubernaculifera]
MPGLRSSVGSARTMAAASWQLARGRVFRPVVAAAAKKQEPRRTINVMTYNILAEKYTLGGWHSYCPTQHLKWESRRARILEEIESYDSDIICLQEVEAGVFSELLQPWLQQRGYRGHFQARQYGENVQGAPEGVALFYRTSLFEPAHVHEFTFAAVQTDPPAPLSPWLSSSSSSSSDTEDTSTTALVAPTPAAAATARGPNVRLATGFGASSAATAAPAVASSSLSSSSSSRAGGERRLGRGGGNSEFWSVFTRRQEGAILALLRHRPSKRLLLAGVTHLFWNPAFPDVKAFQAAALCREAAAFLRRHCGGSAAQEVPVVLAGDFNSLSRKCVPDVFDPKLPRGPEGLVSGVYALMTRGRLPPDHPDHPASRRRPGETANGDFRDVTLTSSGLRLASAYCLAHGRDPPLTTRTATFAGCLDYIFISPQHFEIESTLELPYDDPSSSYSTSTEGRSSRSWYDSVRDPLSDVAFTPIPDDVYPSDHLSLAARLRLKD